MKTLTITQKLALALVFAFAVIGCFSVWSSTKTKDTFGATLNSGGAPIFYSVATSSAESVGTSNTRILATSTGRTWMKLSNNSAFPIFCAYRNGAPAANNQGFLIAASTTYEMNQLDSPVYTGAVNCIAQGGAATIWIEANQ